MQICKRKKKKEKLLLDSNAHLLPPKNLFLNHPLFPHCPPLAHFRNPRDK